MAMARRPWGAACLLLLLATSAAAADPGVGHLLSTNRSCAPGARTLEGHRTVWTVAVDFERGLAVSGGVDTTIKIWNLTNASVLQTLEGHSDYVNGVAADFEQGLIVSGSYDQTVKVWNVTSGSALRTIEGSSEIISMAVDFGRGLAVAGTGGGNITVLNITSGSILRSLKGHSGAVTAVEVDFQRGLAVSASSGHIGEVVGSGGDDKVKVWNISNGSIMRTLEGRSTVAVDFEKGLAVSSDAGKNTTRVWHLMNGSTLQTLEGPCSADVVDVDFERSFAISGCKDMTITVWNLTHGSVLRSLDGGVATPWWPTVAADFGRGLAVSAGSEDGGMRLWGSHLLCLSQAGQPCPGGSRVTTPSQGCGHAVADRQDLPLGCSWKADDQGPISGEGLVFNQGSPADVLSDDHPQVCRMPHSCVDPTAEECQKLYLCICPQGHAASSGCAYDGQLKCVIVAATPNDWLSAVDVAVAASVLLLGARPCIRCTRKICIAKASQAQDEQEPLHTPTEPNQDQPGAQLSDQDQPGVELLVLEKWAKERNLGTVLLLFTLGRLNSQVVFTCTLAWLCSWGTVSYAIDGHDIHVYAFMVLVLLTSMATACAFRAPGQGLSTALDLVLPQGMSVSGAVAVDGRTLAVVEVLRLVTYCALVALAPGIGFWAHGWPLKAPETPATSQLAVLHAAGLRLPYAVIVCFVIASGIFAAFHSLWTLLILLCPSSSRRLSLSGSLAGLAPEEVKARARSVVEQQKQDMPTTLAALWASREWRAQQPDEEEAVDKAKVQVTLINRDRFSIMYFLLVTILPLVGDFLSDLLSTNNYMAGGHVFFGTGTLSLFGYTAIKDHAKWWKFPQEVRDTLLLGYQTEGLWELRKGEVEDEALLSFFINIYGLPWAVHSNKSLALQLFLLALSAKGIADRLKQRDLGL